VEHRLARRTVRPTRVAAVVAAALALTLAACSSDDEPSASTTTSTAAPSTTTTAATTTAPSETTAAPTTSTTAAPAPTTTPTTPGEAALPTTPEAYATGMIEAWVAGDQAEASRYGTPDAVTTLFGLESGGEEGSPPPTWSLDHCEGAAGSSYCSFTAGGSAGVTLRVLNEAASQGQEHAVTEVRVDG
jgi:hypothetical protein